MQGFLYQFHESTLEYSELFCMVYRDGLVWRERMGSEHSEGAHHSFIFFLVMVVFTSSQLAIALGSDVVCIA